MAKRKKSRKEKPRQSGSKMKFYPTIVCLKENKVIGVSKIPINFKCKAGRVKAEKVNKAHWREGVCSFLSGYEINFEFLKDGQLVFCPKCLSFVDFIVFGSTTVPSLNE